MTDTSSVFPLEFRCFAVAAAAVLALGACGGDGDSPTGPSTGSIGVTASTSGEDNPRQVTMPEDGTVSTTFNLGCNSEE